MAWPTVNIDTTHMDSATDNPGNARADIKIMADNVNAIKDAKGAAEGIAPLDAGGKVPTANLPTIPANKGGTGQTSYSVGDILYASASGTLTKLSPGTSGHVLTSQGAGNAPVWQAAGGGFTTGTRMSFNQTVAPTGWTKDTTAELNDSIMRIVTGTVGSGGATAFSTFNGQTSTGARTLTTSEIPSHRHQIVSTISGTGSVYRSVVSSAVSSGLAGTLGGFYSGQIMSDVGGGDSHSHTMISNIKYNDFIIASKN